MSQAGGKEGGKQGSKMTNKQRKKLERQRMSKKERKVGGKSDNKLILRHSQINVVFGRFICVVNFTFAWLVAKC